MSLANGVDLLYSNAMRLPLGIIFIAIPLFEIYLFIVVGGQIGALSVIALILITALVGLAMLQNQGFAIMGRFRKTLARGEPPEMALAESFFLLIGGLLLLVPGFFTDAIGLLCLLSPTRRLFIIRYLMPYLHVRKTSHRRGKVSGRIIDVEKDE